MSFNQLRWQRSLIRVKRQGKLLAPRPLLPKSQVVMKWQKIFLVGDCASLLVQLADSSKLLQIGNARAQQMTNDIIRMSQLGGFNTYLLVGKKRQSYNSYLKNVMLSQKRATFFCCCCCCNPLDPNFIPGFISTFILERRFTTKKKNVLIQMQILFFRVPSQFLKLD